MNKEVKERWITALRDGTYKQGRLALRIGERFCCLGVLCDIYDPTLWTDAELSRSRYSYKSLDSMPPLDVMIWAGLTNAQAGQLANANDNGSSFDEIAKIIEEM